MRAGVADEAAWEKDDGGSEDGRRRKCQMELRGEEVERYIDSVNEGGGGLIIM